MCYGSALQAAQRGVAATAGDSTPVQVARLAHRVIATTALVGVLTLGCPVSWWAALCCGAAAGWPWPPRGHRPGRSRRRNPRLPGPAVAMGNLLDAPMFALCWRLAAPARATGRVSGGVVTALAWLVSLALLLQLGLGALTSSSYAGLSCSGLFDCLRSTDAAHCRAMLDPWREPTWGFPPLSFRSMALRR